MGQDPTPHSSPYYLIWRGPCPMRKACGHVELANRYLVEPDEDEHSREAPHFQVLRDRLVRFSLQHGQTEIANICGAVRARFPASRTALEARLG